MVEWRKVLMTTGVKGTLFDVHLACGHVVRKHLTPGTRPHVLRCRECEMEIRRHEAERKILTTSKSDRQAMEKKADRIFSRLIRQRDGECILKDDTCSGRLECAHYVARGAHALRWHPYNAIALCQEHHRYYTDHETEWRELYKERFPGKYEYCEKHRWDAQTPDLELVLIILQETEKFARGCK